MPHTTACAALRLLAKHFCSYFDSCSRPLNAGLAAFLLILIAFPAWAFDAQGHRGARGLAPENTLPAFERALEIGVTTLELDIGITADGVVVVSHDPYLDPLITRDAQGKWLPEGKGPLIRTLTLAQLQTYDVGRIRPDTPYANTFATQQPHDGARIPTLADLFARVDALGAATIKFNIETKINPLQPDDTVSVDAMTDALLQVVKASGMTARVSIQSFDWRTLQRVRELAPGMRTVHLTVQTPNNDNTQTGQWTGGLNLADHASVPHMVKAAGGAVWSPNAAAVTEALVRTAHGLGLQVIPWTVNTTADMERLLDWGVDGLISDYPDRLRSVMRARQMPLPCALVSAGKSC